MIKKQLLINMFFTVFVIMFFASQSYSEEIKINGIEDQEIISLIRENVSCVKRKQNLSNNSISMKFIIENDIKTIKTILASFGYFDSVIKANYKETTIVFDIDLLDRYCFYDIELMYKDYVEYTSGITVGEVFDLICIKKK